MKKRNTWKDFKIFIEPVRHFPKEYIQITVTRLAEAIFAVGSVWFLEQAISAIESNNLELFKKFVFLYWGVILIFYPLRYLRKYREWNFFSKTKNRLDTQYIGKFVMMDNNEAEWIWTGKLIGILEKGLWIWVDLIKYIFRGGLKNIFTIILGLVYIGTIIKLAILYLIGACIVVFVVVYFLNQKAVKARKKRRDVQHTILGSFVRIVMSKFEILQSNKKNYELDQITKLYDRWYVYHKKSANYMSLVFNLPLFLVGVVTVLLIWQHGKYIFATGTWFAELTVLLVVMGLIGKMLHQWIDFFRMVTKDWVHVEKVLELFEEAKYLDGYDKGKKFEYKKWHIICKKMDYAYPNGDPVFQNFDLEIEGGKKTAFVGVSWSWKSTLVKLISGYLTANEWKIMIDGQNLQKISLKSYYQHIGYLTQEPSIFDGTIRDNLMYAMTSKVSNKELEKVIQLARCDFVHKFQNWLNTEIGEKWIRLSGGQRQRLAIAKIFLKDPKIVILDEPTSALDSFAENKITEAMHNLYKNRTVIIIAHRLQTVKEADDIIVMDEGKIIEHGTHANLIRKKWYYTKMLELQSGF